MSPLWHVLPCLSGKALHHAMTDDRFFLYFLRSPDVSLAMRLLFLYLLSSFPQQCNPHFYLTSFLPLHTYSRKLAVLISTDLAA